MSDFVYRNLNFIQEHEIQHTNSNTSFLMELELTTSIVSGMIVTSTGVMHALMQRNKTAKNYLVRMYTNLLTEFYVI